MPDTAPSLGHAVLRVRSLERSLKFYRDALGLKEVARLGRQMVFLSSGEKHHDLGLLELGDKASSANANAVGLYHLAFKVGNSLEELRAYKKRLESLGVPILGQSDHRVSQSLYLMDPDGIEIEVFVDADPAIWKRDPSAVGVVEPLDL